MKYRISGNKKNNGEVSCDLVILYTQVVQKKNALLIYLRIERKFNRRKYNTVKRYVIIIISVKSY